MVTMNVFYKKFLFNLLLCQALSIFELYASDNSKITVTGTLNINPTTSVATTRLMVDNVGIVNIGDGTLSNDSDPRAVLYLWHTTDTPLGTDVSEIKGKLNIKQNGDLLNTRKMYIRPSSIANSAILTNDGLFINQGELVVGSGTALICQKLSTTETDEIKKRGRIWNGFTDIKYTCAADDLENIAGSYSLETESIIEPINGIVTCIPGATINDGAGTPDNIEINSGIFNITKYLGFTESNAIEYTINDKYRNDNNTISTAKVDGQKLQVDLKNITVQLFEESELEAKNIDVLDNGEDDNDKKLESMFSNLNFTNCTAEIPEAIGSYKIDNLEVPFNNPIENQSNIYLFQRNLNTNIFPLISTITDNNFLQIRKLFDYSENNIYYGTVDSNKQILKVSSYNNDGTVDIILYNASDANNNNTSKIPTNGLILTNNSSSDLSFSELFNEFIKYNCYINVQSDNLFTITNNEKQNNILDLQLNYFGTVSGDNPYTKDIYIQLIGNKNIIISNSHIEIENEEEVLTQYDNSLRLVLYNPWVTSTSSYTGKLYRKLPDLNEQTFSTNDAYRQAFFSGKNDNKILQALSEYTYNFIKQAKYWSIVPQKYLDDLNAYKNTQDFSGCLDYVLNNPLNIELNNIVILGYFLEKHQITEGNTGLLAVFMKNYFKNNYGLIQKPSDYNTNYDNFSVVEKQEVLLGQAISFSDKYPEIIKGLSQYTLQFVQDNLDYDSLEQTHKDYLESEASDNDKLDYVLNNFTDIGSTIMLDYFIENKRISYNTETAKLNTAVKITQIYQNYDGPAFNNYKVNFINSHDSNGAEISDDDTLKSTYAYCENVNYTLNYNCDNFSAGNETTPLIVDNFEVLQNIKVNETTESNNLQASNILTNSFKIGKNAVFKTKGIINVRKLKKSDFVSNGLAYTN